MGMKSVFERPEERLQTTDEKGNRVYIHPEDIKGRIKTYRFYLYYFLILFFLVLPWIRLNGKQSILIDLPARTFHFFGNTFYGHDAPYLFFFFIGFAFLVAIVTSIWGRVWCGFACPQTVFIQAIFNPIEKFIEGPSLQRMKLETMPWNFHNFLPGVDFSKVSSWVQSHFVIYAIALRRSVRRKKLGVELK